MKTTVAEMHNTSLAAIVIDEIRIIGSRCGPFDLAIETLVEQKIDLGGLITHRFPLKDARDAFAAAVDPNAFKVIFQISELPEAA